MPATINKRVSAELDGGFVLFLIGLHINRISRPWVWMPVMNAMPRMLKELQQRPELGLLHARMHFGFPNAMVVQYWRSHELLQSYAEARDHEHLPAWAAFNRKIGTSGDIGIWHETYVVDAGRSESIYVNMPPYGLGIAGTLHEATGSRASARRRLRAETPVA